MWNGLNELLTTLCLPKPKYAYKHIHIVYIHSIFIDFSLNGNNVRCVKVIRRKDRPQKRGNVAHASQHECDTIIAFVYTPAQFQSQRKQNWYERHSSALTSKQTTNCVQYMPTQTTYIHTCVQTDLYTYTLRRIVRHCSNIYLSAQGALLLRLQKLTHVRGYPQLCQLCHNHKATTTTTTTTQFDRLTASI